MIRYVFRLFGLPIFTVDTIHYEIEGDDEDTPTILGGASHDFERDANPITPEDRYDWEWEDRKKGFGFR